MKRIGGEETKAARVGKERTRVGVGTFEIQPEVETLRLC